MDHNLKRCKIGGKLLLIAIRKSHYELSIGTKIGDLEWPSTAQWPLHCVISLNLVNLRSNNRVDLWRNLCTSLLYFVVRVRFRSKKSSRSLSHLLMSFLSYTLNDYDNDVSYMWVRSLAATLTRTLNDISSSTRRSSRAIFVFTRSVGLTRLACAPVFSAVHTQVAYTWYRYVVSQKMDYQLMAWYFSNMLSGDLGSILESKLTFSINPFLHSLTFSDRSHGFLRPFPDLIANRFFFCFALFIFVWFVWLW